jgi:hypothetical protein
MFRRGTGFFKGELVAFMIFLVQSYLTQIFILCGMYNLISVKRLSNKIKYMVTSKKN